MGSERDYNQKERGGWDCNRGSHSIHERVGRMRYLKAKMADPTLWGSLAGLSVLAFQVRYGAVDIEKDIYEKESF